MEYTQEKYDPETSEDLIQDFDVKRLKRRQASMLKKAEVPLPG